MVSSMHFKRLGRCYPINISNKRTRRITATRHHADAKLAVYIKLFSKANMPSSVATAAPAVNLKTDAAIISLIGFAHGTSHFFHLMLPPLFPWFMSEFSLSFVQVGTLMTTFFVVSGVGQAFAGMVVDRYGAHRVLCVGVGLL